MAATTTSVNACNAVIRLDNGSDVLTDISGSSNELNMEFSKPIAEFKVFGLDWHKRMQCGKDASFSLKVVYTTATDEGFDLLKDWYFTGDGTKTLQVNLPSDNTGNDRYSGEFLLESLSWGLVASEAGPIMVSAELKPDGEVTYAVISS